MEDCRGLLSIATLLSGEVHEGHAHHVGPHSLGRRPYFVELIHLPMDQFAQLAEVRLELISMGRNGTAQNRWIACQRRARDETPRDAGEQEGEQRLFADLGWIVHQNPFGLNLQVAGFSRTGQISRQVWASRKWAIVGAGKSVRALPRAALVCISSAMSGLHEALDDYIRLVEGGRQLEAMEKYYADEVVVRENRNLSRAGREECLEFEREMLEKAPCPPKIRCVSRAVDGPNGTTFVEWVVRFVADDGHVMLLEEVAVARWSADRIVEERFYYEGFVDEGPAEGDF